jgi:hypothetical protein
MWPPEQRPCLAVEVERVVLLRIDEDRANELLYSIRFTRNKGWRRFELKLGADQRA